LYGEHIGVRSARKHIGWYVRELPGGEAFRSLMNLIDNTVDQFHAVSTYFDQLHRTMDRLPLAATAAVVPETEGLL